MIPPDATALRQQLESEQHLANACLAGLGAALAAALIWAGIGLATGYEVRFMAIAVGFLVGYAVRLAGKGISAIFGVVGVAATIVGCGLGNLFTVAAIISGEQGLTVMRVLAELDYELALELLMAFYQPIDTIYYGVALFQGYNLAFRRLSDAELALLVSSHRDQISGSTPPE